MNPNSPFGQRRFGRWAFTLVELLVVICIICILAALAFPALNGAIESSRKVKAKSDVTQIVASIKAYQTEYGKLPIYKGTSKYDTKNDELFNILRSISGLDGEQLDLNPRRIPFIEIRPGKGNKDGLGTASAGAGIFYDPWGTPYQIILDDGYDNNIANPYSSGAGFPDINTAVIALSAGKDKIFGSGDKNAGSAKDDVISWQ